MTPQALRRTIQSLRPAPPITVAFSDKLGWGRKTVWYKSQKEHWLGWLSEYDGPGFYGRTSNKSRSAEFAYNHIVCPPMVLWLVEASGVENSLVIAAKRSALKARSSLPSMSAAIRKIVPWTLIETALKSKRARSKFRKTSGRPGKAQSAK